MPRRIYYCGKCGSLNPEGRCMLKLQIGREADLDIVDNIVVKVYHPPDMIQDLGTDICEELRKRSLTDLDDESDTRESLLHNLDDVIKPMKELIVYLEEYNNRNVGRSF